MLLRCLPPLLARHAADRRSGARVARGSGRDQMPGLPRGVRAGENVGDAKGDRTVKEKYCTVVFRIKDDAAWAIEWTRLHSLFLNQDTPLSISAVSADHEMDRVALIEEAMERYDDPDAFRDAARGIIECGDIGAWEWP